MSYRGPQHVGLLLDGYTRVTRRMAESTSEPGTGLKGGFPDVPGRASSRTSSSQADLEMKMARKVWGGHGQQSGRPVDRAYKRASRSSGLYLGPY